MEVFKDINEIINLIETLYPKIIKINNISILKQPNEYTCGITSIAILSNFYNNTNIEVDDLIIKYKIDSSKGVTKDLMIEWLGNEIQGRKIIFRQNVSNEEMIKSIHFSLLNNNPILILFGSPNPYNKPYYDGHASVLYGIDLEKKTIFIANAYGYNEEITIVDFLNRMAFTEIDKYPPSYSEVKMDKNSFFIIE